MNVHYIATVVGVVAFVVMAYLIHADKEKGINRGYLIHPVAVLMSLVVWVCGFIVFEELFFIVIGIGTFWGFWGFVVVAMRDTPRDDDDRTSGRKL